MIMKWEDLEIGDKIKWRDEAIDYFEHTGSRDFGYYTYYLNKILTVVDVKINKNTETVDVWYFREDFKTEKHVEIDKYGKCFNGRCDAVVFEVVELRED